MDKVDQREAAFECNDLNLSAPNTSCFFDNNKPADCLFEERNKIIQNSNAAEECSADLNEVQCADMNNDCSNLNSADCNLFNLRKKCKHSTLSYVHFIDKRFQVVKPTRDFR